jgi:hypothetical protein
LVIRKVLLYILILDICIIGGFFGLNFIIIGGTYEELLNSEETQDLSNTTNVVVVVPVLTANAYRDGGFYDYYYHKCDVSCLSLIINPDQKLGNTASAEAVEILKKLNYTMINDYEIDSEPNILNNYKTVILLHNEYVTKKIFDAITTHPNVIFLYPNSLYAEITIHNGTMVLVRGHGYPNQTIDNGFDWEFDNTHPYEFDHKCENWRFYKIKNGWQLNCYPEEIIKHNYALLATIKELSE